MSANGHGVSFWGDGNVLELDSGDGCTTLDVLNATHGKFCILGILPP